MNTLDDTLRAVRGPDAAARMTAARALLDALEGP